MFFRFIYILPSKYSVICSHQVSYTENFLSQDPKLKRLITYLVTTWWLFYLSADLLDKKIQTIGSWKVETILSRFLRNLLTRYLRQPNYAWLKWNRNLLYREPKSESWSEECPKGQIKFFMFIILILLYSVLAG